MALAVAASTVLGAAGGSDFHRDVQAVDTNGVGTWTGPAELVGVLLNNPEEMLDPAADFIPYDPNAPFPIRMGGQWQVFVQATHPDDAGGTALWVGQNYGNMPFNRDSEDSYSDAEWQAEVDRLSHDSDTGHRFRKGDLVRVVAPHTGFYGGKTNVNEGHDKSPARDFEIHLVQAGYGLPAPVVLDGLAELKDASDAPIFDATRQTGGERYQGTRVRINGLTVTDDTGWSAEPWGDRLCTAGDGTGRTFALRMPRPGVIDLGSGPATTVDVVGLVNQESGSGSDGTSGYELFVSNVIGSAGDATLDGVVDVGDLGVLAANWGDSGDHVTFPMADFNTDASIDVGDLGILAAHWGASSVPEPVSIAGLLACSLAAIVRRRRLSLRRG